MAERRQRTSYMTSGLAAYLAESALQKATLLSASAMLVCARLRKFQCKSSSTTIPAAVKRVVTLSMSAAYDMPAGRHWLVPR